MFIDQAKIYVKAGDGGRGCNSLYRDKYQRDGVPDGGAGGRGADVVAVADRNLHTLLDFRYNRHFRGANGAHGSGKTRKGRDASVLLVRVPCGTVIKDASTGCVLRDLDSDRQEIILARGGNGGLGNTFRREATPGEPGEEKELILDLKVIADVGVIGFPNAGKSTLVSAVSNAHPKVACYPFTTKFPVLGVVRRNKRFVIADIPGLIEGSSRGRGLGDKFLRHVERTKILVHLIDMSATEGRDPVSDYKIINDELKRYGQGVYKKHQIVVANKMDLESAVFNFSRFRRQIKKKVYCISALAKDGLEELIGAIEKKL